MLQWFNKKIHNRKGFTLIELVVVIAILGILAAIAVPRFTGVTADAQVNADKATARTILSAITMAEAALKSSGEPTDTAVFTTEVNKALNSPVTYGNAGTGWQIYYDATTDKVWEVYKDKVQIKP